MLPSQAILDLLPDLVLLVEPHGRIVEVNATLRRMLDLDHSASAGRSIDDLIWTPRERAAEYLRRCSGTAQPLPGVLVLRRRDGSALACRCDGARMKLPDGGPGLILLRCRPKSEANSTFRLLNQKISDLTKEIAARRAAEQALKDSEQQFRTLADSIPQLAWMARPDGWIFWYNRRWYEYTGTRPADMQGWGWQSVHDPEMLPSVLERWRGSIASGKLFEMVFPLRGADGVYRPFLTRVAPVRDHEGRVVRWFGTNTDIAEQRSAEQALRNLSETLEHQVQERTRLLIEANERLIAEGAERRRIEKELHQAQKMEAVGQLTGGVAHDFNNLLTVVLGALDTLEGEIGGGRLGRLVQAAKRAALRGATLTSQLLAFSRKQLLKPQQTDMNELISGMGELLRGILGSRIELKKVLTPGAWPVLCDPNQLETVFLNLALNARDAMPEGGTLTFETSNFDFDKEAAARQGEVRPGEYVLVAVTDTGTGIPPTIIDRIFEPFFSTKEVGKGTGLGLSQVYGFVKQSGGHVRIHSEVGVGTTVRLYLPRSPEQRTAETPDEDQARVRAGPQSVFVVEDDPEVREFAVEVLRGLGYRVLEASNGSAALRLLRDKEEPIDLLFTDVIMPGPNGFELAKEALRVRPTMKVLFTSGYTANALPVQRPLDGRLLPKPYKPIELAREVRAILDAGNPGRA